MLTEKALKEQLKAIAANDYQVPAGTDAFQLARSMTAYLGAVDPELRDDLIYNTFAHWIWHQNRFDADQLKALLDICLDEAHLEHHLGERDTDTVFMRSFSALHMALIMSAARRAACFTAAELHRVKHALVNYLHVERDLRGYVPGKGWAHAIAHAADALDEFVQFEAVSATDLQEVLGFIRIKASEQDAVYQYDEDERLTVAVLSAWNRGLLSEAEIIAWIRGFAAALAADASMVEAFRRYVNVKHFLRSLFFRASAADVAEPIIAAIMETLAEVQRF